MDSRLREIERKLSQSPDDEGLHQQWMALKVRMGEADIQRFYKVRRRLAQGPDGVDWLSKSNRFTDKGSHFKTKDDAINAALRVHPHLCQELEIVFYESQVVEVDVESIDFQSEQKKRKLAKIQKKKRELEKQEQELLGAGPE